MTITLIKDISEQFITPVIEKLDWGNFKGSNFYPYH